MLIQIKSVSHLNQSDIRYKRYVWTESLCFAISLIVINTFHVPHFQIHGYRCPHTQAHIHTHTHAPPHRPLWRRRTRISKSQDVLSKSTEMLSLMAARVQSVYEINFIQDVKVSFVLHITSPHDCCQNLSVYFEEHHRSPVLSNNKV